MGKTYKKNYNEDDDNFYNKKNKNNMNKNKDKKIMNALKTKNLDILTSLYEEDE